MCLHGAKHEPFQNGALQFCYDSSLLRIFGHAGLLTAGGMRHLPVAARTQKTPAAQERVPGFMF